MDFTKDYYKVLKLSQTASKEEVKAAYRHLVKLYHPDRNQGDTAAEERSKDINEAYEVLYNDITRHIYDEYRKEKEEEQQRESALQHQEAPGIPEKNKRTYVRTHTTTTELRTYVKGIIVVKYWGEPVNEGYSTVDFDVSYRIHPTDVRVIICRADIHPRDRAPVEFQQSYKESELFTTPLSKPINCVIQDGATEEHYALDLSDIRVKNPTITNVTKHEGESLGTLTGELYAYVNKFVTDQHEVPESECFGDTGKVEFKNEDGLMFIRREAYNFDCTTGWGAWQLVGTVGVSSSRGSATSTKRSTHSYQPYKGQQQAKNPKGATAFSPQPQGCTQYAWVVMLMVLAVSIPPLGVGIATIGILIVLVRILSFFFDRVRLVLPALGLLCFALVIIAINKSASRSSTARSARNGTDSVSERQTFVKKRQEQQTGVDTSSLKLSPDTLISHFVRWRDYDSAIYEANLSVSLADLRSSAQAHERLANQPLTSLQQVYQNLEGEDGEKLNFVYAVFDSIGTRNSLNERRFAAMLVSCIQSLPYYLVLQQSCNSRENIGDEFIANYLAACARDCCIGNVAYGVESPVEFIGNLKGDCDTRALLAYKLLKRFGYNVALLTSNYYKHAVVAVHFRSEEPAGLSMNIGNKNYYLWELTSSQLPVGTISPAMQDLSYWEVTLVHESN